MWERPQYLFTSFRPRKREWQPFRVFNCSHGGVLINPALLGRLSDGELEAWMAKKSFGKLPKLKAEVKIRFFDIVWQVAS